MSGPKLRECLGHRIPRVRVRDEVGHRIPRMRVRGEPAEPVAPAGGCVGHRIPECGCEYESNNTGDSPPVAQ